MKNIVTAALKYAELGFSVIPVQKNKKPYVSWEKYQHEKATPDQIREWWQKYPNANIAIVTGGISGLNVVDIDSQKGMEILNKMLPDSLVTPISRTPRGGWHYYHQSQNGLSNAIGFIEGVDFRGQGGYCIAPPSIGYSWLTDLSIFEVSPAPLPEGVLKLLKETTTQGVNHEKVRQVDFSKGKRDNSLFHTALNLLKGGTPVEEVKTVIVALGSTCKPPFPAKQALIKVESAFKRLDTKSEIDQMREWIQTVTGIFTNRQLMEEVNIPFERKAQVSTNLNRLVDEGLIIRAGGQYGIWRRLEEELQRMSLKSRKKRLFDIKLPFGLNEMVEIRRGNIIAIAGMVDAGKTSLLLNIAADNMYKHKVHYFSSEMPEDELYDRMSLFTDVPNEDWDKHINAYARTKDFADVIRPGEGNINIVDYLELSDEYYKVAGYMTEIFEKLNGAIAIIGLQKNPGVDIAKGGWGSAEKARLYLSIEAGVLKIIKGKNWAGKINPKGLEMTFKLRYGAEFEQTSAWLRPDK